MIEGSILPQPIQSETAEPVLPEQQEPSVYADRLDKEAVAVQLAQLRPVVLAESEQPREGLQRTPALGPIIRPPYGDGTLRPETAVSPVPLVVESQQAIPEAQQSPVQVESRREIDNERRSEVRDAAYVAPQTSSTVPSPASSILTEHYQPPAATARQLAETQANLAMQHTASATPMATYKRAALTGFIVGVCLIGAAIVAYMLFAR